MATPLPSTCGVSAVSDFTEGWKQDAYVGYSIYCETAAEMKQVLQAIQENIDPPCQHDAIHRVYQFYFLHPAKSMIVTAFDSWRYRLGLRDFGIILHRDVDTAQEGSPSRMRPARPDQRSRCMHFLPPQVGGVSAAAELLEEFVWVVGSSAAAELLEEFVWVVGSEPLVRSLIMGGASADVSDPGVNSGAITPHRSRCPPPTPPH